MVVEQGSCTAKECHTASSSSSSSAATTTKCGNGVSAGPLLSAGATAAGGAPSPNSPPPPAPQTPQLAAGGEQGHHIHYHHQNNSGVHHHHHHHHNYHHHPPHHQRYSSPVYNAEHARMEAWMDENQEFMQDYIIRKATRQVVDAWLVNHATPSSSNNDLLSSPTHHSGTSMNGACGSGCANNCSSRGGSGATTPVR